MDSLTKEESFFSFNRLFFRRLYAVVPSAGTLDNSLLVEYRRLSHSVAIEACLIENLLPLFKFRQNALLMLKCIIKNSHVSRDSYCLPDRLGPNPGNEFDLYKQTKRKPHRSFFRQGSNGKGNFVKRRARFPNAEWL